MTNNFGKVPDLGMKRNRDSDSTAAWSLMRMSGRVTVVEMNSYFEVLRLSLYSGHGRNGEQISRTQSRN